jgi:hypothetical protein
MSGERRGNRFRSADEMSHRSTWRDNGNRAQYVAAVPMRLSIWIPAFVAALIIPHAVRSQAMSCLAPQKAMVEIELLFGRNIGGKLGVSEARWRSFLAKEVTPRVPDGFTVFDTAGQWQDAKRKVVVREPGKILRVIVPADAEVRWKFDAIASAYKKQFRQDSVGVLMRPACVSF